MYFFKNQKSLLKYAELPTWRIYGIWHRFAQDYLTKRVVTSLVKKGQIEVNKEYDHFRIIT